MLTLTQLVAAVSVPTVVALIGILMNFSATNRLSDRIDRMGERIDRLGDTLNARINGLSDNFNNQVTVLLNTIHDVNVRVARIEERDEK